MEIKGKVHCFFEQSGTFKNEFIKLGQELKQEYEQTRIALCRERNMIKRTALSTKLGILEKQLTEKRKEANTRRLLETDEELSFNFVCDSLTVVALLDKVTDLVMDIQKDTPL